jgi:hypothetical protein
MSCDGNDRRGALIGMSGDGLVPPQLPSSLSFAAIILETDGISMRLDFHPSNRTA